MATLLEQTITTLDPPTPDSPAIPTVTYHPSGNLSGNLINAWIIISRVESPSSPRLYNHLAPPICIPGPSGSIWTVTLNLVALDDLTAVFDSVGFEPLTTPPGVGISLPPSVEEMSSQLTIEITNTVSGSETVLYRVFASVRDEVGILRPRVSSRDGLSFDPTIAVVEEPMGG